MDKFGKIAVFPWFPCCCGIGIFVMILLYRDWQKFGGDEGYIPPLTTESAEEKAFEVLTKH